MPFDNELTLRDGSVDLDENEALAVSKTANSDGAAVVEINGTGVRGLAAVLILPTAPTTYADTLAVKIQHSHYIEDGWEDLAIFPTLYALVRRIPAKATTAFVSTDIGLTLTGGTTGDTGTILWFDPALKTIGGEGDILVQMVGADDLFDDVDEALTATAGTGIAAQNGAASALDREPYSYGVSVVRFTTERQYVRGSLVPSAGSNFGKASLLLSNSPVFDL